MSTAAPLHDRIATAPPPISEATLAHSAPARVAVQAWLVLAAVVAVSAAYVFWHLGRGWMPFDDGALAQSAERLLHGELPHRDFDDIYTGGLAALNAAAFRLFGTTLWSMRLMLFAAFLAWVPAVFFVATRFLRPLAAGVVTLLAVVWSVPNYPAAMPSWYNLFLATLGTAALMRHLEDRRARWLVLAGVAGGLSFLVKVVGLYYVAAVLLFLVFHEGEEARARGATGSRRPLGYALFVTVALVAFVLVLSALVGRQWRGGEIVHFVVPSAAIAVLLARLTWSSPAGSDARRFRELATLVGPFLAGVALPVALFLLPYATSGALGAFMRGVFVAPMKRFAFATAPMLPPSTMVALIPLAVLVVVAWRMGGQLAHWATALLAAFLLWMLRLTAINKASYQFVWESVRNLTPALAIVGVAVLWRMRPADRDDPLLRRRTLLIVAVTALCSLVQYPYAEPNYFCYVAPLVALTAAALSVYAKPIGRAVPALAAGFYLLFAVLRANTTTLFTMGYAYVPYGPTMPLHLERAGPITVFPSDVGEYEALIPIVRAHARGEYVWASPDCPEVYFLAGLRNPTRSLFDFFDAPEGRDARILGELDTHAVNVIVLNRAPSFSRWLSPGLLLDLYARYPHAANAGRFHVRWRS